MAFDPEHEMVRLLDMGRNTRDKTLPTPNCEVLLPTWSINFRKCHFTLAALVEKTVRVLSEQREFARYIDLLCNRSVLSACVGNPCDLLDGTPSTMFDQLVLLSLGVVVFVSTGNVSFRLFPSEQVRNYDNMDGVPR